MTLKKKMDAEVKMQVSYLKVMLPELTAANWESIKIAIRLTYLDGRSDGIGKMLDIRYGKK